MRKIFLLYIAILWFLPGFGQALPNDNCSGAIVIDDARDYCSGAGQYTNTSATPSFTNGPDVWFKFEARNFEIKITVTGGTAPSMRAPEIRLFGDCSNQIVGSVIQDGNTTIFHNSGVIPGKVYYVVISSSVANAGTFQLCLESYQSQIKPGQDFSGSTLICTTEKIIHEVNIAGSGNNQNEAIGTCLDVEPGKTNSESNSAWYKWTAANSGTLVFTITPEKKDDIDWVLYELGPEGNPSGPNAGNVVRCAAGHGIDNSKCPSEAEYTQTGLDFNETDDSEASGCGQKQNGVVRFITMKQGYVYALLVNNAYNGNNGFEIAFTDRSGKAGTGSFKGPSGKISQVVTNPCSANQSYTFTTTAKDYDSIKWYFGSGASIPEGDTNMPYVVTYSTPGLKTVVMQLKNNIGCSVVETQTFMVGTRPDPPILSVNKADFCLTETIKLSTPEQPNVTYKWTGPNNFISDKREPEIVVNSTAVAGTYTLVISRGDCSTAAISTVIPPIYNKPEASFRADPPIPAKLSFPATVRFFNESRDADTYLWDFGDGQTSTEVNPEHIYTGKGNYNVTLTAIKTNVCSTDVTHGTLMISEFGAIFVPNTFTPNNDAINDQFVVNMNNIKAYRIQIYNRYGVPMYISDDLVQNWDGTYKNEPVPVGTYYYVIDAVDLDNQVIQKSGSVTILR